MNKSQSFEIDNDFLIPIYKNYLDIFEKCKSSQNINLMGFLFHELMFISSSLVYKKFWGDINDQIDYPYIGYRKDKYNSHESIFKISHKKTYYSIKSKLKFKKTKKIGIVNPGLNIDLFISLLKENDISYTFLNKTKLEILNFEKQLNIISEGLKDIFLKYDLNMNVNQIVRAVRLSFEKYKEFKTHNCEMIIIGSPVNIPARIIAADAMSRKIPVLCLDHGNETGTEDSPAWGYDEQSFCSHFLGFGMYGKEAIKNSKYIHPLDGSRPKYFSSDSSIIRQNYKSQRVFDFPQDIKKSKLVYIPNKLMGVNRLGPFLSISDNDYINWQKRIISSFDNIIYKVHPKQKIQFELNQTQIIREPLEDCLNDFDIFIVDNVVSTAFANIACTKKPIIYFNIGIGNVSTLAKKTIKERVMWINVDLDKEEEDLYQKIFEHKKKKYTNNHTSKFSLSKNHDSRELTSIKIIESLI